MQPLQEALKYRSWIQSISAHGIRVANDVKEIFTLRKKNGEVLFSLIDSETHTPEGNTLPGLCLLRGHFVCILTCLIQAETNQPFLLLVRQRRICNGAMFYEHPAGMMDMDTDPYDTALKELEEETGLIANKHELKLLNTDLYFSSPGLLDEGGYFFYLERVLPAAQIKALHNQHRGAQHENENIMLHIATVNEALQLIKNTQGLLCTYLWLHARKDRLFEDIEWNT